jgi:type I restriction enzyme R subunit
VLRHFIVFEDEGAGKVIKKMAGYHQFHAVNRAITETVKASRPRATAASAWCGTRRGRARA